MLTVQVIKIQTLRLHAEEGRCGQRRRGLTGRYLGQGQLCMTHVRQDAEV